MGRQDRKKVSGAFWNAGVPIFSQDDEADNTGLFGLGHRVTKDMHQENTKTGFYGLFGARHIAGKARDAQDKAAAKKGWFSSDARSDRYIGSYTSSSGWRKVSGKKGWFQPAKKGSKITRKTKSRSWFT